MFTLKWQWRYGIENNALWRGLLMQNMELEELLGYQTLQLLGNLLGFGLIFY